MATVASNAAKNAPVSGFQFEVYTMANHAGYDPIPKDKVGFTEVSGLADDTDAVEYKEGNDLYVDMLPGMSRPQELTLGRGVDRSGYLIAWRKAVREGTMMPDQGFRCDLFVVQYDRSGTPTSSGEEVVAEPIRVWKFTNAWPRSMSQDDLNSTASEISLERVVMCYRGPPEQVWPAAG